MSTTPEKGRTLDGGLDRALALVDGSTAGADVTDDARERARDHAVDLFDAYGAADESIPLVVLAYAAELLSAIGAELAAGPREARRLIDRLEHTGRVPRVALGRAVLQPSRRFQTPAEMGIGVRLSLLLAFTGAGSLSLWTAAPAGELKLEAEAGDFDRDARSSREAAVAVFEGGAGPTALGDRRLAVKVDRLRRPPAVLVAERIDAVAPGNALLLETAVPVLAGLLDRRASAAPEHSREATVLGAVERRLARLRFDLHDGPQQDVHLLAQDLALFRQQLRPMIAGDPNAGRLLGRLDDLEAMLVALDGDLRRMSTSVESPFLTPESLPEALRQLTDAFAARTGVEPSTHMNGPLTDLTDSQQITLLSLIREALSNIRKHSDAAHVTIRITSDQTGVRAEVSDDGSGFDPEATLVRAARAGRLGLVGMHERVRMLGGRTQIDSRPGGPTVISATLPQWPNEPER